MLLVYFQFMKYGIATLSIIPLRKDSSHKSEMVTQLLFGEAYEIIQVQGNWLLIKCCYDQYEGWIDQSQHHDLSEKDFDSITGNDAGVALDLVSSAASGYHSIPVVCGSNLPFIDGMNFKIGKDFECIKFKKCKCKNS